MSNQQRSCTLQRPYQFIVLLVLVYKIQGDNCWHSVTFSCHRVPGPQLHVKVSYPEKENRPCGETVVDCFGIRHLTYKITGMVLIAFQKFVLTGRLVSFFVQKLHMSGPRTMFSRPTPKAIDLVRNWAGRPSQASKPKILSRKGSGSAEKSRGPSRVPG